MPACVFHTPYALEPERVSASAIRPIKMRNALEEAGYKVFEITGHARERRARLRYLREHMDNGLRIDFVYSENATIPPSITEPKHLPVYLGLDRAIFRFFHQQGVPVGVFYRDIYWKFDSLWRSQVGALAWPLTKLYQHEVATYNKYADVVYLPSRRMEAFVPELHATTLELPPGGQLRGDGQVPAHFNVFYTGSITGQYRLKPLTQAVADLPEVRATLCVPRNQWNEHGHEYPACERIQVSHASGDGLDPLYDAASVAFVGLDSQYGSFAQPVKFYEYLAAGKPVVANTGTLVAELVEQVNVGWVVNNEVADLKRLLARLQSDPQEVKAATQRVLALRHQHTWVARARQVARDLMGGAA